MPVLHDKEKLKNLLLENNIPLNDAVRRGKFYKEYFDWDKISSDYVKGKSIRDICKEIPLSYDVVRVNLIDKLKKLGAFDRKGKSKFFFNFDLFFPKLNNVGAYLLGWLYSDGYVTDSKIGIGLSSKDTEHLRYLASLMSKRVYL